MGLAGGALDVRSRIVAVAAVASGANTRLGELERAGERRKRSAIELDQDAAPLAIS